MSIDTSKMGTACPYCDGTGSIEPDVGARLLWLRKQTGETQEQLAESLAISRPSLVNMEQGRQSITQQNIRLICLHFGVSADWFLGLDKGGE